MTLFMADYRYEKLPQTAKKMNEYDIPFYCNKRTDQNTSNIDHKRLL